MKKSSFMLIASLSGIFLPLTAFAQTGEEPLLKFVNLLGRVINQLIPIASLLVVLAFFWGLVKFIASAGNEEKSKEAKSLMIRGILGMFVLVSIWGIIGFLQASIGTNIEPTPVDMRLPDLTPGKVNP